MREEAIKIIEKNTRELLEYSIENNAIIENIEKIINTIFGKLEIMKELKIISNKEFEERENKLNELHIKILTRTF